MADKPLYYNIATIRKLLLRAFNAEGLHRFCLDQPQLRPVVDDFGPKYSLNDMVDGVIEYCWKQNLWDELLTEVKEANPKQYARFESDLMTAEVPPDLQLEFRESEPGFPWRWVAIVAAVLAIALILLGVAAGPRLREAACGPLGCKPEGVQRFAIADWENLTPGRSRFEVFWTEGTRRSLYEKLSHVETLDGIGLDLEKLPDEVQRDLDLWIDGDFSQITQVKLSAAMTGRAGRYRESVSVSDTVDEASADAESQILELQDRLARAILSALGIELQPAVAEAIGGTPTSSGEALQLNNQAVVLVAQGNLTGAEALLQAALALDPAYADAHNNLGRVLQVGGDLAGAIAEYQRATELLPRISLYYFNLGLAYDQAQDYPAALHAYEQAIALDPAYVKAINNLGFVHLETGELDQASQLFNRGLRLDPNAAYLYKNLGRVLLEQGQPTDAIVELKRAVELSDVPYAEALFYLAEAHRQAGQMTEACAALASYLPLADADDDPDRSPAARTLAEELDCP
jgi:tetratricopeptide (TPR) repeat protein